MIPALTPAAHCGFRCTLLHTLQQESGAGADPDDLGYVLHNSLLCTCHSSDYCLN